MTGFTATLPSSAGGATPYSSRPGRTRSNHVAGSASSAALFAACRR